MCIRDSLGRTRFRICVGVRLPGTGGRRRFGCLRRGRDASGIVVGLRSAYRGGDVGNARGRDRRGQAGPDVRVGIARVGIRHGI